MLEETKPVVDADGDEEVSNNFAKFVPTHGHKKYIPEKDPLYVPFGHFKDIKSIIKTGYFLPVFVTGLSGNGKTKMLEQIAATLGREFIRVNFTPETDEDDLIGGHRLVNGSTEFHEGPVIEAMRRGAILCLDEIDRATAGRVMCLQSILEGVGYLIKKTGVYVTPEPGFTIVATANTKGRGSDDGRFMAANVLDDAFLERFELTYEQDYPPKETEVKILARVFEKYKLPLKEIEDFNEKLCRWAESTRKTFKEGGINDMIATRRLVFIVKAYAVFKNRKVAIERVVSRFDEETKTALLESYKAIDEKYEQEKRGGPAKPAAAATKDYMDISEVKPW